MTLSDRGAYGGVIGCLMRKPSLLLEYPDLASSDFDFRPARVCFGAIKKLFEMNAKELIPIEVDQEIERNGGAALQVYKDEGGLDFLKNSYEFAQLGNFEISYTIVKKNALLRKLQKANYDISEFYVDEKKMMNPIREAEIIQHLRESSIEDILNSVEKKYSEIRNEFLHGGRVKGDPAEGIYELIEDLKKSPSIGPNLEGQIFSTVCRGARDGCFYLKSASTSAGKAIPNYTIIPMADGSFKRVQDIEVGDYLIGDDGKPTKVIARYPQPEPKEIYEVVLADGRIAECCEDHLWQYSYAGHAKRSTRVESAKDILKRAEKLTFKAGKAFRFRIPLNQPVQYKEKELYPSPYAMGALIGDGSFRYSSSQKALSFSSAEEELVAHVAKELGYTYQKNNANNYSWTFREHKKSYAAPDRQNVWVEEILIKYPELWQTKSEDKFIPEDYLISSVEQRMELLRGLLDTDGSIDSHENVRFTTISKKLKDDVIQLCHSLGFITNVSEDRRPNKYPATGVCYTIGIKVKAEIKPSLFSLTRKVAAASQAIQARNRHEAVEEIAIVDIRPTGRFTDMTCFTVDNTSHLFLMNDFIVTHNTRTSVFDACRLCYPKRWSWREKKFIEELDVYGEVRQPRKVLFIVTEMDKEEIQTIMLAYLSGVDEDHILRGQYEFGEETRVQYAASIIEEYRGYFIVEAISDPNLQNVEATIRKYATVDEVKYVFFDYIHSTASMIGQFARNNVREDVILMLLANQLKQLAKDYNLFIFSATQVNAGAMGNDEMMFMDEKTIRGAKSIADKADVGYVMTRLSGKGWNSVLPQLRVAAREGIISQDFIDNPPTHILDIYKMRRGRYKMVRIWTRLHLGTGEREDLFITNAENQPIKEPLELFTIVERPFEIRSQEVDDSF